MNRTLWVGALMCAFSWQVDAEELEARIERVESVRAIKRLQSAYGHYTELGLWNDFADLFTDTAKTNYQQGANGKAEIRKLFFEQVGQGRLGLADGRIYPHILFQPVITLSPDGQSAKGRWRILAMLGGLGGSATWYSGVYENEYVREGGVWKISVLHSEPKVTAAYTAAGWRDSGAHVPMHFSVASLTSAAGSGSGKSTMELALRAERLKDEGDVSNVLNSYGYAVDGRHWKEAADLFAPNGTLELGQRGVYAGPARIRRALEHFGGGAVNDHVYLQTVVTVDAPGHTAKARGVELVMSSAAGGELQEGVFENTFVKQGGEWKIQSVHFYPRMIVHAALGWAKSAKPAPGLSKEFPPDRGPTEVYEIYPKFSVAPFHFVNPVTGKEPQYPEGVRVAAQPSGYREVGRAPHVAEIERDLRSAEARDAAENLVNAYGYFMDESPGGAAGLFARGGRVPVPAGSMLAHQTLQPVIRVAGDGRSVQMRARRLDLGAGPAGWTAGTLEGRIALEGGAWKFDTLRSTTAWSAAYPAGWGR